MLSLDCRTRWPESCTLDVPCYRLNVVTMYHLNGYTVCYVQRLNTILTVGDAVHANLPMAVQHNHLVLSIRVPVSVLSTRLAAVELAMPRTTSVLHRALPYVPNL
jgi:hypothetical protein